MDPYQAVSNVDYYHPASKDVIVMQKVRILFVVLQLDAGGSERVVFDLARSLDRGKFEVFVAAFKGGVLAEPLQKICNELFFIDKKPGFDLSAMLRLADIVKANGIDVVNAHHYMPCFYSFLGTRVLNGKRLVYTEHSVPEVEEIAASVHGRIFQWLLYRITAVVGVSRAIAGKFREKYPRHAGKIHEILNGVDIEKYRGKGNRTELRRLWGLDDDCFVVGTVANFRNVKNHVCLVRAAGRLKDSHKKLRLFFVGTGFPGDAENSEEEVRMLISELGLQDRVVLAGYQENVPELLPVFDAFCLPSLSEGLPVSLLEAMAAGIPVIGSRVRGIIEVVTDGTTGMLFSSNDDEELSRVLSDVLDNPARTVALADNAYVFVQQDHSLKSCQEEYFKILDS